MPEQLGLDSSAQQEKAQKTRGVAVKKPSHLYSPSEINRLNEGMLDRMLLDQQENSGKIFSASEMRLFNQNMRGLRALDPSVKPAKAPEAGMLAQTKRKFSESFDDENSASFSPYKKPKVDTEHKEPSSPNKAGRDWAKREVIKSQVREVRYKLGILDHPDDLTYEERRRKSFEFAPLPLLNSALELPQLPEKPVRNEERQRELRERTLHKLEHTVSQAMGLWAKAQKEFSDHRDQEFKGEVIELSNYSVEDSGNASMDTLPWGNDDDMDLEPIETSKSLKSEVYFPTEAEREEAARAYKAGTLAVEKTFFYDENEEEYRESLMENIKIGIKEYLKLEGNVNNTPFLKIAERTGNQEIVKFLERKGAVKEKQAPKEDVPVYSTPLQKEKTWTQRYAQELAAASSPSPIKGGSV
ncbi:MAG: hypothetical protein K0R63_546 [Rickettsiales bacterium]|nr:hypothetical protein [Rickettsiales bacterium]